MCDFAAEDIIGGNECQNEGGLEGIAFYSFAEDIESWPALPTSPASFAESATLIGDFVMKPGKYFARLESELEMSKYNGESQGATASLSAIGRYNFRQAPPSEQVIGFVSANKNRRMAIIFECYDGTMRVLGRQSWPARMSSFEEGTGSKMADERYMAFVMDSGSKLPLYYEGVIPIAPSAPENAIVDENGEPLIDEEGNYIIYE